MSDGWGWIRRPTEKLGGWALGRLHYYEATGQRLLFGGSSMSTATPMRAALELVAGTGHSGFGGDVSKPRDGLERGPGERARSRHQHRRLAEKGRGCALYAMRSIRFFVNAETSPV
jgi:hypothetical protein